MTLLDESPAARGAEGAPITAGRSPGGLVRLSGLLIERTINDTVEAMARSDEFDDYRCAVRALDAQPELTRVQEAGIDQLALEYVAAAEDVEDAFDALGLDQAVYVTVEAARRLRADLDRQIRELESSYEGKRRRQFVAAPPAESRSYWGIGGAR